VRGKTRARAVAVAFVVATASAASASLDLIVENPAIGSAAGSDGGVDDTGFDADVGIGSDAPQLQDAGIDTGAGSDAPPGDAGSDSGMGSDAPPAPSIDIVEDQLAISGPQGTPASATATVVTPTLNTTLSYASVSDPGFGIELCGGAMSCSLSQSLPTPLTVTCTPGPVQTQATLYVAEPGGASDMAIVYCNPTNGGPQLHVSPVVLDFGSRPVGATASEMLYLRNDGAVALTNIVIALGANAAHWSAGACTAQSPCSLPSFGSDLYVTITFQPTTHGDKATMAQVTSMQTSSTPKSVDLRGTGTGGLMAITSPQPANGLYALDLGTIPLGQITTAPIVVRNNGNASLTAMVTGASPPYTIAPASTAVGPSTMESFVVSCGSDTASPNNDQVLTVASDAYAGSPQQVTVHCAIANTLVQVNPLAFDFGELRTNGGAQTKSMTVTVTNPASSATPARLSKLALRVPRTGLTLTPAMTDTTLAPGTSASAVLELANLEDTDLAGEFVDIAVDGESLALPVTGKVVTAKSRVAPKDLDLGTACVGTQITGYVMLVNEGTATLAVETPQIDQSFVATSPGTPRALPPTMSVSAEVSPADDTGGPIGGILTWHDDVPTDHQIPVKLDYVTTGTALSPRGLDFGTVAVDAEVAPQRIKLQNCELANRSIEIQSLRTRKGTLGAWIVEPRVGFKKTLAGREEQAITVTFDPPARGRYEADLTVLTEEGKRIVHLVGDATGRDFDRTSFYACACSGGGTTGGWPVLLAVLLVSVRRRPGSSSAR
jgi:uncharacterized protein (TIGR03382 family)